MEAVVAAAGWWGTAAGLVLTSGHGVLERGDPKALLWVDLLEGVL